MGPAVVRATIPNRARLFDPPGSQAGNEHVMPSADAVPVGQSSQLLWPGAGCTWLAPQSRQTVGVEPSWYVPAGQALHGAAPVSALNVPVRRCVEK